MVFRKVIRGLVISETDIDMAIDFISRDPLSYPNKMPGAWTRQRFLVHLNESIKQSGIKLNPGANFSAGYNIWAHIDFVGLDLIGQDSGIDSYQVYLSIRTVSTNLEKMVKLG